MLLPNIFVVQDRGDGDSCLAGRTLTQETAAEAWQGAGQEAGTLRQRGEEIDGGGQEVRRCQLMKYPQNAELCVYTAADVSSTLFTAFVNGRKNVRVFSVYTNV